MHQGLAEQSFRHQVQTIMGDGQLTAERAQALAGPLPHHCPCLFWTSVLMHLAPVFAANLFFVTAGPSVHGMHYKAMVFAVCCHVPHTACLLSSIQQLAQVGSESPLRPQQSQIPVFLLPTDMRQKMGLSEEAAKKIIKGVQNQRLIGSLQAAKSAGALTLERLRDMAESGVDIESFVSEDMRVQLYTKEVRAPFLLPPLLLPPPLPPPPPLLLIQNW